MLVRGEQLTYYSPLSRLEAYIQQHKPRFNMNPYAQGGWYNPQNPQSINSTREATSSIFGALPYPTSEATVPTVISFQYVVLNPNVLNCMITGPTSIPFMNVATQGPTTVFRKADGRVLASIDWSNPSFPCVEILSLLSRRPISEWLRLSQDRR
jgi:hypothetical protein